MGNKNTECIKALIDWANKDINQVLLFVGFDLAVVSIVVSSNFFGEERKLSWPLVIGICFLLSSAASYLLYVHSTHMAVRTLVHHLHKEDYPSASNLLDNVWAKGKLFYYSGHALGIIALPVLLISAWTSKC